MLQRSTEILVFEAFPNEQVSVLMGSVTGLQSKNIQLDQAQKNHIKSHDQCGVDSVKSQCVGHQGHCKRS